MPLVHRLTGPEFTPSEVKSQPLRASPATLPQRLRPAEPADPDAHGHCALCAGGILVFDPARSCCVDRYERQFGTVQEHRSMFTHAKVAAILGDLGPARRLVESYRRVFGPMAAIELRRTLWRAISEARTRPIGHERADPVTGELQLPATVLG